MTPLFRSARLQVNRVPQHGSAPPKHLLRMPGTLALKGGRSP